MASSPLDELMDAPGAPGDYLRASNFIDSGRADQTLATVQSAVDEGRGTISRSPGPQQQKDNRIRAEDLKDRGIPYFTNASGGVSPVTDDTGEPLTGFNKRHNIAYDSKGEPKTIEYDETGPPSLGDPFDYLPTRLDKKTGALEKKGPAGLYRYEGQDPVVTANLARAEKDKTIQRETTLLNRKLSLDEHDLHAGTADQKILKSELKTVVPSLIDPKYEGADRDTVLKAIDEHFDTQYASPEANNTRGWFGKELSPEATARRQEIDGAKAKAHETAAALFDLNDQLSTLHETVSTTRQKERQNIETMLAHAQGQEGPLDQAPVAGPAPRLEEWGAMLGGKEPVTSVHEKVQQGEVPPHIAPAVVAATHDMEDARKKAEQFKTSDPTLADHFRNIAQNIQAGLVSGIAELGKGTSAEPSLSTLIDPLQQAGLISSWVTGGLGALYKAAGSPLGAAPGTPAEVRAMARKQAQDIIEGQSKQIDDRLKDTLGSKIANFAGGVLPYVAAAVATKGKSAATPLLASMFYTSGYQSTFDDAKANGATDQAADLAGIGVGTINAVLALPLRTVGKAAEAIFGDTAPKVIQRAITNAYEHGGPEAVGGLLGRLSEAIKAGGAGAASLRTEAVEGINMIRAEMGKTAADRLLTVAKTAATHAAMGAGVQTSSNLVKKTYNPDQGTFEGVPEQAIGFAALGGMSEGFRQIAMARKAKQALDLLKPKGEPPAAGGPELGPGPEPTPKGPTPKALETAGTTEPPAPTGKAQAVVPEVQPADSEVAPATEKLITATEIEPVKSEPIADIATAEKAYVEQGGHADKLDAQNKLAALRQAFPDPAARIVAIQERLAPSTEAAKVNIDEAAHAAATSPTNTLAEPTEAQKEAGNYQKGHIQVSGLDVSIEHPAGTKRKPEFEPLQSHYGYIKGTVGADKDHVDIFIKQGTPKDWEGPVFVVNQHNKAGKFDEHKAVIGVETLADAKAEYLGNYEKGWTGGKSVTQFENPEAFKAWLEQAKTDQGVRGQPALPLGLSHELAQVAVEHGVSFTGAQRSGSLTFADTAGDRPTTFTLGPNATPVEFLTKLTETRERMSPRSELPKLTEAGRLAAFRATGMPEKQAVRLSKVAAHQLMPAEREILDLYAKKEAGSGPLENFVRNDAKAENKVTNLAKGHMAKHRPVLDQFGHAIEPRIGKTDHDSGLEARLNREGVPTITLDPAKLAKATEGMDDRSQSRYIQDAIDEEVKHVVNLHWEKQSPENRALLERAGSEKDELDAQLAKHYPGWDKFTPRQKGHEKLRFAQQKRPTEASSQFWGKLGDETRAMLKAFLKFIKELPRKLSPALQQAKESVEAMLRGEKEVVGERGPPEPAPKQTKLQARASELENRLKAVNAPGLEAKVIQTLLQSGTGAALDQAQAKIEKLELAKTGGSWNSIAQDAFKKQKAQLTRAQNAKDWPAVLKAVEEFEAFWDARGTYPDDWARWERAKEDAKLNIARGEVPTKPSKPEPPVTGLDEKADKALGDAFEGLFAAAPAGQRIDSYEGKAPRFDWNATDNYGVWSKASVAKHLGVPNDNHVYRAMVDLGDLQPKRVEKEDAKATRGGKSEVAQEYLNEAEALLEKWTDETDKDPFKNYRKEFAEFKDHLTWNPDEGYDESDVEYLAREMQARSEETGYDDQELSHKFKEAFPPIVVTREPDGKLTVDDGNHRADIWREQGFEIAPAWVNDAQAREGLGAAAPAAPKPALTTKERAMVAQIQKGRSVEDVAKAFIVQPKQVEAAYDKSIGLGSGMPALQQKPIPAEKIGNFVAAAQELIRQNIDTPEKLAAVLESKFAGKARPFSQALWDMIATFKPELRGTHDWPTIYGKPDQEKEPVPGTAAPLMVLPQNRDQLIAQVALTLQTDPLTRRQLTELAKEAGLDVKRVDEAAETGIVKAARYLAGEHDQLVAFDQMVELYDRQPNLTAKTSTSKVDQAYSTPVPLAYAASRLADIRGGTGIYEPTAGNGVLLMEADPKNQTVIANEINGHRLEALSAQGFKPTANDATKFDPPTFYDRVIANPPFGTILDANQQKKTWPLWDKATDQIDHAISAKALDALTDDGRAVLILGGKNMRDPDERAKAYIGSENQRNFWPELYKRYNVVDHFTIDGDLYSKQGAGWPVDVVIIAGRSKSKIQLPSAEAPRILTSWSQLRDELSRTDAERIEAGRYDPERDSAKVSGIVDSIRGVAESESGIGPKRNPERAPTADGGGGREESVAPSVRSEPESPASGQPEPGDVAPARGTGELGARATDVELVERGQQLAFRVPYKPASQLDSFGIFIPTNMEAPASEALERLQERIGPIDEFVRTKLGYRKDAPLKNYFSAEQMDALALGIDAIDGETAFVLGDQGGVGKGRVAAGMIAYAKTQGKVPIFITKDEKLYAAMIEDLHDIGQDHVMPVFTNNGIAFEDYSGTKWNQGSMTNVMKEVARTGKLPMHADVLFTTYSQIQTDVPGGWKASKMERASLKASHKAPPDGVRMEALKKLAPGSIIIADESHLAAGDSIRAWRLSPLLAQAHGVYYSSATFAKRPDSMGIYSRTSLSHATTSMGDLVDAMKQGGVPLQQVVSATLASDGLYLRRERDFSKAVFRTQINVETRDRDAGLADNYTEGLRAILNISNKMKNATDYLNKILRREAKQMHVENAPRVESTNFSSKLHNLVSQYLFAIKAEAMVRRAVHGVTVGFENKDGQTLKHKVIIAVQNTMEQPILALERSARPLNFKGMLLQYLDTQRTLVSGRGPNAQVTRISDTPDPNFERYSDVDLQRLIIVPNREDPERPGVNEPALNELFRRIMAGAFKDAETLIESLDLADMPLSPIDHIRLKLSQAGIKNAEITKRGTGIDEDGSIYKLHPSSNTKAAHLRYMSDFNNGDTEVMVINASGSTGISLHSSKKFKRTDPRAMIIGQPHLDINEFMQTLYRTDRTGQVHQPYYELLQTAIPAELRPAAILNRKMGSLNANTTSNAENEISAGNVGVDIFNQYGDEVVYNYLKSDRVFTDMLDMPKIMTESGLGTIEDVLGLYEEDGQFAAAVTGRVAVLPTAEQEEFWNKVSADYVAKIDYLNELGENELQAEAIDMKAETIDRKELTAAVTGKGRPSGFDQPSYMERIKADIGMKPLAGTEVVAMMEELGAKQNQLHRDWFARAEAWKEKELARLEEKVLSWDAEKQSHYEARWREQAEEISAAIGLIGDGLHLKTEKGLDGYGAITDVKFDDEHPLTPSKQIFTVHVNTTKKMLRVAASQLPAIARQAVGDFADLYEATAERSNQRYMITGNLLSAYLAIRDAAPMAKIVQYTTNEGELRQGILMPQKFSPGALSKKRVVESASHMRTLLDAGRGLTNADASVSIVKPSGPDYVMRVPSSRVMGGAYWRDSQLAGLMHGGEFVERSGAMIGKFDAATLPKVYQRLLDLNATMFFTEEGEALGAGKPHKAVQALYKDDVEPILKNLGLTLKESFDMLKHLVSPTSGVAMDAHDRVMKMLGERNQKAYETDRVLDAWRVAFDKMPRPEQIAFIDRMKLGKQQATPELQELAQTMRKIDTESWDAAVAAYSVLGFKDKEIPLQWLENHYRVLWKRIPGSDDEEKKAWIGKTRRGLRGSMGQHKQHTLETMSDGLAMGGIPYSYNPVEMFKLAQADLWKLTTTLRAWKWAKTNHFVEYVKGPFPKAPDGMVKLDDPIARVYFPSESGEGLVNAGQYFVEEGFGRLLNNYLSTDHIRQTKLGRGLLWLKNATTSLELSLSPFHAVFETMEMVGSDIGLGLSKLVNRGIMRGDLGAAAQGIKEILAAPASPITGFVLGREIRKAAADPDAYFKTAAGKKMLKTYPRAREFIDDLFSAGWKPNELEQDWKNESVRTFVEAVADLKAGTSDNYIGAGLRAFPAANEMLMKPLFDIYIPSLKVAQFFKEYAEAIEQNERKLKGGILTRAALARQVWRFVEDRFGEMNFDSLFWNRNFKTGMQLMFRSVTWKLGSVHAFGGAFGGQAKEFRDAFRERRAPELHRNMAWLFGMFLLTAAMGAIISKVLGKKNPETLTDYVFPQIDPKDDKVRVSLPTYFKDMVHLIHSPTSYVTSSMSGWIGRVADLLRNKDYYGVQIRDTDESIVKQALQVGKYTGETLLPFSVRGYKNLSDQDVGALRKALAFVAINPAPRHISQSKAEKQSEEYWKGRSTEAGISPEQFEAKKEKRRIVGQLRHGETPDLGAALAAGTIKPVDIKPLYERARIGPLASQVQHMPLADAEKVYQRASLKERADLAGIMEKKRANSAKRGKKMFTGF